MEIIDPLFSFYPLEWVLRGTLAVVVLIGTPFLAIKLADWLNGKTEEDAAEEYEFTEEDELDIEFYDNIPDWTGE